jgi:hypothetical protein
MKCGVAFRQGLRELNYVEGQNLIIDFRWPRGGTSGCPRCWLKQFG